MDNTEKWRGHRRNTGGKSVFLTTVENAEWTNTIWKWGDGTTSEKLVEKCGYIYEEQNSDRGGQDVWQRLALK
jgi:hypothetical protein